MATVGDKPLYDEDFYAWTQHQAEELRRFARTRPNLPLDLELIAEEIADLGKSERDAVFGLARLIMQHFLLIMHSPAVDLRRKWGDEVDEFRDQIADKITPTIRRQLESELVDVFARARRLTQRKLRRHGEEAAADALPTTCPWRLEQILGDWQPAEDPNDS